MLVFFMWATEEDCITELSGKTQTQTAGATLTQHGPFCECIVFKGKTIIHSQWPSVFLLKEIEPFCTIFIVTRNAIVATLLINENEPGKNPICVFLIHRQHFLCNRSPLYIHFTDIMHVRVCVSVCDPRVANFPILAHPHPHERLERVRGDLSQAEWRIEQRKEAREQRGVQRQETTERCGE